MTAVSAGETPAIADSHGDHGSDLIYWKVFGFLFVMTALEVSTELWPESMSKIAAVSLIFMMVIKFGVVAWFFMHLKDDAKLLGQVFFFGVILAMAVYIGMLGSMLFFNNSGTTEFNDPPREQPMPPPATDPPPIIRETGEH